MNLTAEQVGWLNSPNPSDNAKLLASLGGDEVLMHKLANMFGPGGQYYDHNKYGFQSGPQELTGKSPEALAYMLANGQAEQGPDGKYYVPGTLNNKPLDFYSFDVDPNASWSGVNAQGGFAGGTGTAAGVTPRVAPVGSTPRPSGAGGPNPTQPGGTPLSTLGGTGGAVGGSTTPSSTPGGSTSAGNSGNTGGFPMASASTYNSGTPYTPPSDVTTPFDFYNDEGYKFALGEGKKSIENSAAARGGLLSGNTLKELSNYQTGLASQYYGDAFNRQMQNKNFNQNVATDARNFNNSNNQFDATFNNNNRMWDTTFNNNNRIDARNFDYGAAINDRNFNEDQRRYDQGFNYNAATGDRNFDASILNTLYNGGLSGSQSTGQLASVLASLLSGNTLTGAGAGAAGTVGGANNINQIISTIIAQLNGNRTVTGTP